MTVDPIQHLNLDKVLPEAKSMRAKLDTAATEAARHQLDQIGMGIRRETELGRGALRVEKFQPGVKEALERKGYKVTYYSPDQRDGGHGYYTVSW